MKLNLSSIVEKFNALADPVRYGIFGGALALIFAVDYLTIMALQRALLNRATANVEKLKSDINHLIQDKGRLGQLRQNLESSRHDFENFHLKVRLMSDMSSILENMTSMAGQAGVKLDQLSPQTDKQEKLTSLDHRRYMAIPVLLEAHGGYHAWGRFLNSLETGPFHVKIKTLTLLPATSGGISIQALFKLMVAENEQPDPV